MPGRRGWASPPGSEHVAPRRLVRRHRIERATRVDGAFHGNQDRTTGPAAARSTLLAAFGDRIAAKLLDDAAESWLLVVAEAVLTTALIAALLAAIYRALPDLKIEWREVALGACVTAVLVSAGKFAISFYFGRADPGSVYGAAGPLVLLLLWVYYSAWIVLLGAEFTQAYSCLHGPNWRERSRRRREHAERRRAAAT